MIPKNTLFRAALSAAALSYSTAHAATILGGSLSMTIEEGKVSAISEFNALFDDSTSRANTLALAAPGNALFTESPADPSTGTVTLSDPVRPAGAAIITGDGRTRQQTTLDFDPSNVLGSWSAASSDFDGFVGNGADEQIALTSIHRYTGPFTGQLIYGDFALRYVPARAGTSAAGGTRSGLVLTSNIDFTNAVFADIGNASIAFSSGTLQINGDLLIGAGLSLLDPSAAVGTDFGNFSLTAQVPEPAALAIVGVGAIAILRRRRSA
jgi:hypothetical protein